MTETLTVPELPAAEVVGTGMERADWLARRRLGIGGSDVAALLGISPWHSQMSLWMEKRGELENAEQTDNQRWGLALEEPIRSAFEEDTDIPVLRLPPITMYRSKQLPIALISPDGLTVSRPPEKGLLMGHMVVEPVRLC
jgi:predicted phage-related endonuclease